MFSRLVPAVVLCLLPLADVNADLQLRDFNLERHTRFENDPSFIGNPHDWSGVSNSSRWATMITPKHFVSANHFHPGNDAEMTFHHTNDLSGASETHTVLGGQRIGGDLWLGELETEVSENVALYSVLDPSHALGREIQVFGRGNQRMGRNTIDRISYDFVAGNLGVGHTMFYDFDEIDSPNGLGGDEARLVGGDSGGPSFVILDDKPVLVGVHWFIYDEDTDQLYGDAPTGSGDAFIPGYINELNEALAGSGYSLNIASAPEPSAMLLATLLAIPCASSRRRRKTSPLTL